MLNTLNIQVGSIIHEMKTSLNYRVIYLKGDYALSILINTSDGKFIIYEWWSEMLHSLVNKKEVTILEPVFKVFDINRLSKVNRVIYERNKDIVTNIEKVYGPCYFDLANRKSKPIISELMEKYKISRKTIFRIVKKYLQSGKDPYSLLNQKGMQKHKNTVYQKKTGHPSEIIAGIPMTKELRIIFDDTCKQYLSGREKSYANVYDWMCTKYFTEKNEVESDDGEIIFQYELLPDDQRPTLRQMEHYIRNHTTLKQRKISKTSTQEYRNNERMLVADNLYNVNGPGDVFEMDEVEMDVSLVSELDSSKVIGRPIVHVMVDVYSRMIAAISVSLENNSILGFTNCLLNLGEDNKELCRRFGLEIKDGLWDINVIPNKLRCDRGAEYRSKEVKRILNELNITLELAPPAMGSLKGQVEQLFHQYHSVQNELIEKKGLITKRHDSKHHKEAVLTLDDIWIFVINQTIAHNMLTMKNYPMTKDMLKSNIHPNPIEIWNYGCNKYGSPKPIVNLEQFEYIIRKEITAKITRKGIEWNGLYYITNDPWLYDQITNLTSSSKSLKCRLDPRNIDSLWFIQNNTLVKAHLNEKRSGNAEFNGMSLKAYEEYKNKKKELIQEKIHEDQQIRIARRLGLEAVVNSTVQSSKGDLIKATDVHIRENRKKEAINVIENNTISSRLDAKNTIKEVESESIVQDKQDELQKSISNMSEDELLSEMFKKM